MKVKAIPLEVSRPKSLHRMLNISEQALYRRLQQIYVLETEAQQSCFLSCTKPNTKLEKINSILSLCYFNSCLFLWVFSK